MKQPTTSNFFKVTVTNSSRFSDLLNMSNTLRDIYTILGLMGHCDTTNDLIL